jgi:hypothetical protein
MYPGRQDYALDERLEVRALRHAGRSAKSGDLPGSAGDRLHQ